ncbi:MAG: hypothetical protein Q9222_001239 [Ikaeria aurantiellina]
MTLAPERITVKRRRDEEPVDALYIPPKKLRTALVWNRVPHDQANTHSAYKDPRVPVIKTTSSSADNASTQAKQLLYIQDEVTNDKTENVPGHTQDAVHTLTATRTAGENAYERPALGTRTFRLTRPTTPISSRATLHGGIRKPRKKQTKAFAVFVEQPRERRASQQSRAYDSAKVPEQKKTKGHLEATNPVSSPRKRPLASSAERDWRAHTWKKPPELPRPDAQPKPTVQVSDQDASTALAQKMQQFALEETQLEVAVVGRHTQDQSTIRPKPPKPRTAKTNIDGPQCPSNANQDTVDTSNEKYIEYVVDVYIRQGSISQSASNEPQTLGLEMVDPARVGMLVIEEGEDQEIWELYREEECSDDESWNSEEEDENAEDYYGNDYPEDELDVDDQYDRNVYKHWQGAFEEEEFEEYILRSDDEPQERVSCGLN